MSIKLFNLKGKVVELTCSSSLARQLGAEPADGQQDGTYLMVRASDAIRLWVWLLDPKALER